MSGWTWGQKVWVPDLAESMVLLSTQKYKWVPAICQGCLMECLGGNLGIDWHPIGDGERGVVRLLVALCQGNLDKVQLNGQHGLSTDFDSHTKLCLLLK